MNAPSVLTAAEELETRLAQLFVAPRKAATGLIEARYIVEAADRDEPSFADGCELDPRDP